MKEIRMYSWYHMYCEVNGRKKAIIMWFVGVPLFMVLCIWGMLDDSFSIIMRLFAALFVLLIGFVFCFIFIERKYKPKPSRSCSKEKMRKTTKKTVNIIGILGIVVACLFAYFFYMEDKKIGGWVAYFITGLGGMIYYLYYMNKSIEVHEDVDFVTSSEMENIVGVEIGEKIQATYQNFDSSTNVGLQDGANIMVLSDKKIYFSFLENGEWFFVKKNINEIVKIGTIGDQNGTHLKLLFSDETTIMLHIETYGKATSNEVLFIAKFYEVLDAVILGTVDEKISSRRRVSVNQEVKPVENQQSENKEIRQLDLSKEMIGKLKNAKPVEAGRVLEF